MNGIKIAKKLVLMAKALLSSENDCSYSKQYVFDDRTGLDIVFDGSVDMGSDKSIENSIKDSIKKDIARFETSVGYILKKKNSYKAEWNASVDGNEADGFFCEFTMKKHYDIGFGAQSRIGQDLFKVLKQNGFEKA